MNDNIQLPTIKETDIKIKDENGVTLIERDGVYLLFNDGVYNDIFSDKNQAIRCFGYEVKNKRS